MMPTNLSGNSSAVHFAGALSSSQQGPLSHEWCLMAFLLLISTTWSFPIQSST